MGVQIILPVKIITNSKNSNPASPFALSDFPERLFIRE